MINPLVTRFGKEKRWVNYRLEEVKGKMTKVPYSPATGGKASSTDANTWETVDNAFKVSRDIGIVFTPEQNLLGVDIDHCLEGTKIIHEQHETIEKFLKEADTYTEVSPSGTGLHCYFEIEEGLKLVANRHGNFECYTAGRYFTVTSKPYRSQKGIRKITAIEAISLLSIIGYPWGKNKTSTAPSETNGDVGESTGSSVQNVLAPQAGKVDDAQLLKRIFKAKNGKQIEALYNGDISQHKNDASAADLALLSHLAFYTKKDPVQMERIWVNSPLGSREKTKTRKDYRDRSIEAAINNCTEVYESGSERKEKEIKAIAPELELLFTYNNQKDKVFTQNTENMCRILRVHPEFAGRFHYDEFTNKMEIKENGKWRDLEDNDAIVIQTRISILFDMFRKIGKDMVFDAIMKVSKENTIDTAADYIRGIKWDGEKRLDFWLQNTYGVEDNEYYRAVSSNWMKGLVKRIIEPGCKFDYVLVLEGEQGIRKSTSLGILGGSWHVETTMSTDTKDFFMQFQGKAIIEFSEGETLNRTEVKRMKAIITTQSDKYRPAYGRTSVDFPRRCVFAMTTNQSEYLKDETGNRRWLPVACVGVANVEWLAANRDQLYAEAYERVINQKETTYEFPNEETTRMQNVRRVSDPNTDLVSDWYYHKLSDKERREGITIHQVWRDAINGGFAGKQLDKWNEMSISNMLKFALDLEKRRKYINGVQAMRWFKKLAPGEVEEEDDETEGVRSPLQGEFGVF